MELLHGPSARPSLLAGCSQLAAAPTTALNTPFVHQLTLNVLPRAVLAAVFSLTHSTAQESDTASVGSDLSGAPPCFQPFSSLAPADSPGLHLS